MYGYPPILTHTTSLIYAISFKTNSHLDLWSLFMNINF